MSKHVFKNTAQMIATLMLIALFAASILTPFVIKNLDEQFRSFYVVLPFIYIAGIVLSCFAYWKSDPEQDGKTKETRPNVTFDQSV